MIYMADMERRTPSMLFRIMRGISSVSREYLIHNPEDAILKIQKARE